MVGRNPSYASDFQHTSLSGYPVRLKMTDTPLQNGFTGAFQQIIRRIQAKKAENGQQKRLLTP
jgi:hypothetical protein